MSNNLERAFPLPANHRMDSNEGMTLRDYFAAAAVSGVIVVALGSGKAAKDVATAAYEVADAMLKARE